MEENKTKKWEAIDFIINNDKIADVPVLILEHLLELNTNGQQYDKYVFKNYVQNRGIVFRKQDEENKKGKIKFIECVNKYYSLPENCMGEDKCNIITDNFLELGDSRMISNCSSCHKKCLNMYKSKQLNKI